MPSEINKFYESFKTDRFIRVFVSDDPEPLYVSERALHRTSEWFVAAIRNDHMGIEAGDLRFPEDDLDAWKWLLFWTFYKEVPESTFWTDCEAYQLIHCWCLGEKYFIPEFQGAVLEALSHYLDCGGLIQLDAIKLAFETSSPRSALRELMVKELVAMLQMKDISYQDLDLFDGIAGFASELSETMTNGG